MSTEFIQRTVRLLHLEDNENDIVLVAEILRVGGNAL